LASRAISSEILSSSSSGRVSSQSLEDVSPSSTIVVSDSISPVASWLVVAIVLGLCRSMDAIHALSNVPLRLVWCCC
jgi:hypothetical protein